MKRVINFNAGPAAMPLEVLEQAQAEMLDWKGTGMSVMEVSHRGKEYEEMHNEAMALFKEIAGMGDEWKVLFCSGGASTQFYMIPMNLLPDGRSADYISHGPLVEGRDQGSQALRRPGHHHRRRTTASSAAFRSRARSS